MPKHVVKRFLWFLLLLIAVGTFWKLFVGVDALTLYYQQDSDPGSALNILPNVPPDLAVSLKWQSDDSDTGRVLEPATRTDIESAYLRAWLQWNLSLLKNQPYGLETYFVGPALSDVSDNIHSIATKGWQVTQVDTEHSLKLHFYSADGSIISFTDQHAEVAQIIRDKTGAVIFSQESEAQYQVVMLLADGNWRVRHWVRSSDTVLGVDGTQLPAVQTPHNFVGKNGISLSLNKQRYTMAGINYYPQETPWNKFWPTYSPKVIDKDFSLIHSLGINTIRIFLPFDQFGGSHIGQEAQLTPTLTLVQNPLGKLADLLRCADTHHLKVIVTLFDFRSDYTPLLWPQGDRYLEAILTKFKDTSTILAWDIKNEPNLDYKTWGSAVVNAWLTHTAVLARRYDPHHLLTIGWSTPEAAQTQIVGIDVVSFHYYASASALPQAYKALRTAIPAQPILMTEFGMSTWSNLFFPGGHNESEQAAYYTNLLHNWSATDSAGYMAWTLYDFSAVPAQVAGRWPWQSGPQKAFGLIQLDGTIKPAARVLKRMNIETLRGRDKLN